jgi:hypothetical protein
MMRKLAGIAILAVCAVARAQCLPYALEAPRPGDGAAAARCDLTTARLA